MERALLSNNAMTEFDEDGSGDIDKYEFLKTMLIIRGEVKESAIRRIMRRFDELDEDGSGEIDFADFVGTTQKQTVLEQSLIISKDKRLGRNENLKIEASDLTGDGGSGVSGAATPIVPQTPQGSQFTPKGKFKPQLQLTNSLQATGSQNAGKLTPHSRGSSKNDNESDAADIVSKFAAIEVVDEEMQMQGTSNDSNNINTTTNDNEEDGTIIVTSRDSVGADGADTVETLALESGQNAPVHKVGGNVVKLKDGKNSNEKISKIKNSDGDNRDTKHKMQRSQTDREMLGDIIDDINESDEFVD